MGKENTPDFSSEMAPHRARLESTIEALAQKISLGFISRKEGMAEDAQAYREMMDGVEQAVLDVSEDDLLEIARDNIVVERAIYRLIEEYGYNRPDESNTTVKLAAVIRRLRGVR